MMSVGEQFAVICLDSIRDEKERETVLNSIISTGKEVIDISWKQMNEFAGNVLQVQNRHGQRLLVMSSRAYAAFTPTQLDRLHTFNADMVHSPLTTIEINGGGSARCMLAEIFI